jgi:stringent starvation protein B
MPEALPAVTRKAKRPYLLRAIYDWIVDSGLTPYVLVDASAEGVTVPSEHVKDGKIVLNVGPTAVGSFSLNDDALACDCRFGGRSFAVFLPMPAILAIYARESGEGMVFEAEDFPGSPPEGPGGTPPKPAGGGHLKVVK